MPDNKSVIHSIRWPKTKKVLFNPFFLAIVPSIIIILFLPEMFTKYRIDELGRTPKNDFSPEYHEDLNNNGQLERIIAHKPSDRDCLSFLVYRNENQLVDEYYFNSNNHQKNNLLFFHDVNNNGYKEVLGFSYSNDSVFLNWIEPLDPTAIEEAPSCDSVFITTIHSYNDIPVIGWYCYEMFFRDQNGDGYEEWIIPINAGRSEQPRKIFIYDYYNDSLTFSESYYSNNLNLEFVDFNQNSVHEILVSTTATGNSDVVDIELSDWCPWFKIYKSSLKDFYRDPIQYPIGVGNALTNHRDTFASGTIIYTLFTSNNPDSVPSKLEIRNNLDLMNEYVFTEEIKKPWHEFYITQEYLVFQFETDTIMLLSKDFEEAELIELPFDGRLVCVGDLDDNGKLEFLQFSRNKKYVTIYSDDFKTRNTIYDEDIFGFTSNASFKLSKNRFALQTRLNSFIYSYKLNLLYYFKIPFYFLVFLLISLLIRGIKKIQEIQSREKYELQSMVKQLQLTTIKNQLDPHLTFNALNVVSGLSREGETHKVDTFISRFSKLLRTQLETSEMVTISLGEEIDFVDNFVDLQKIRYEKEFSLIKHIEGESILSFPVPKMLIHTHVENAIKHGILPKPEGGSINLAVKSHDSGIIITIQDNGVGRLASKSNGTKGSETGLKVLDQIFRMYYQLYSVNIRQDIIDLYDENGEATGTLINLIVPKPAK